MKTVEARTGSAAPLISVREVWKRFGTLEVLRGVTLDVDPGEVRFAGDPVALVVAESRYIAEDAADLVVVDFEPLPAVVDYAAADRSEVSVH